MFYLSCERNAIKAIANDGSEHSITSFQGLIQLLREFNETECRFASSMDFPEEYTKRPEIIDLCHKLQSF